MTFKWNVPDQLKHDVETVKQNVKKRISDARENGTPVLSPEEVKCAVRCLSDAAAVAAAFAMVKRYRRFACKHGLFTRLGTGLLSGMGVCAGVLAGKDLVTTLAQAFDRLLVEQEEDFCAPVAVESVPVVAPVTVDSVALDEETEDEEDAEETDAYVGMDLSGVRFIDVMEEPEQYREMLEREAQGKVTLLTRFRRGFLSRVIQSQGNAQEYYSAIKNELLSFKGIKSRVSWGFDTFNKGRVHVAKVNVKNKTVFLYLAMDPATLADAKYGITDLSDKKKYANTPVLMKIKGDRKFKYALELIDTLCSGNMELKKTDAEPVDYRMPYRDTEALVQEGLVKKMVAEVPVSEENVSAR